MKNFKLLSALLVAALVAVPAVSMAQDVRHDDRRTAEQDVHPSHDWHKGDRVPEQYRDDRHVVNDWQGRHLRQPPAGYHWVQVNGEYVLAAVATGVIADILLNN